MRTEPFYNSLNMIIMCAIRLQAYPEVVFCGEARDESSFFAHKYRPKALLLPVIKLY